MSKGTLPEGWSLKRLDELARVTSGKRLPKGRRLSTAQTDHPYIRVTDMFMGGVDTSGIQYVPDDVFPEIAQFTVAAGDIFISCAGTLGLVGIVPESLHGANLTENANRIWSIQCDRRFLLSVLMSDRIQSVIQNIQTVGAQPKLALGRIRSFEILCPDNLPEQQAIAAALSDADGVVAGLERVIAKKRLIKQGAMQDLLTARRRLPGFSGEWAKVQLKDYTSHGSGNSGLIKGTLQRSGRVGDYPAFTASGPDLMLDFFEQEGDAIIISAVGSRCGKAFRAKGKWSAIANTHVLRCREGLDVDFAFIFMNDEDFWLKGGTGQPFVLVRRTLERPLLLPPVNEQQAIASVLRDMGAEIQNLESRLTKARAVKEGMMQNLLTGRVRLV
ncbi:restriction endonuclease subunit S [Rhodobacter capsulatus]|uniref:Type I restriction enzyme, S subunit n=1 Tax=Rhodobacter capsulatus TaxID=1061 RepID=A0A1G7S9F0_RHOCA|nr:restriction endonuclease subunit S [Rhodobacter capsulatus]WER10462.1 restriction endonuclease subunit S [Rhodobacter capsulatus]SDG19623.1 type I restriction enzyme, S subunit [Rhodobacter capsulatus]